MTKLIDFIKKMKTFKFSLFVIILSAITFMIGYFNSSEIITFIATFLLFIYILIYCLLEFHKRIILLSFSAAIFLFLFGRITVNILTTHSFNLGYTSGENMHIILCLFLVYFVLLLVYSFVENKMPYNLEIRENKNESLYKILLLVFIISSITFISSNYEIYNFTRINGYLKYYTDFKTELPTIFSRLTAFFYPSFFCLLAMNLNYRKLRLPSLIYIIISISTLASGQRNEIMMNLVILFIYYIIRDSAIEKNLRLFTDKRLFLMMCSLPIVFLSMNFIANSRIEGGTSNDIIDNKLVSFIYDQGGSVDAIGKSYIFEEDIKKDFKYSFYAIEEFYQFNAITRRIKTYPRYEPHTEEMGRQSHSLAERISYIVLGKGYLNGQGIGTSFVAETYCDFGYIGIVVCVAFYSIFIWLARKLFSKNFIIQFYVLFALRYLIYTPRSMTLQFLVNPFYYFISILIFFLIGYRKEISESILKLANRHEHE